MRRHSIMCETGQLNVLIPIMEAHCKLTDHTFQMVSSARTGTYSAIQFASKVCGMEIREIIQAHATGDYEYKISNLDDWTL